MQACSKAFHGVLFGAPGRKPTERNTKSPNWEIKHPDGVGVTAVRPLPPCLPQELHVEGCVERRPLPVSMPKTIGFPKVLLQTSEQPTLEAMNDAFKLEKEAMEGDMFAGINPFNAFR